jgi:hypothetical protein
MKRFSPRRAGELRADVLAREKYLGIIQELRAEAELYRKALNIIVYSTAAPVETLRNVAKLALKGDK